MEINKDELSKQLEVLYQTENRIAEIIRKSDLRFSTNKMTADIGEFYAYDLLSKQKAMFEYVESQKYSNADFDLSGKLAPNSILFEYFKNNEIRIEVKTRRNQEGVKYLSSIKPDKFDLLCVVDIAKNYTLNKIYLVSSKTVFEFLDRKRQRLIFKEEMAIMSLE
jgi:Holliday junction resolvase-like predicted endonuclease